MPDLPVSRKFLFDMDDLYTKRKTKAITEEEFSIQRDALIAQEAKSHEQMGPLLIAKQLESVEFEVENTVNKKFQKEEQEENARASRERFAKIAELNRIQQEERDKQDIIKLENQRRAADRKRFRETITLDASNLEAEANSWQRWHNWLQITLIILTTATAAMAGFDGFPRLYVVISGFAAAALGGVLSYLQLQDRIYASRKALADLRLECQLYDYCLDEYKDRYTNPEGAHLLFSKKVTAIQARQMLHEVELLNPKRKDSAPEPEENAQDNREKKEVKQNIDEKQSNDAENPGNK